MWNIVYADDPKFTEQEWVILEYIGKICTMID